MQRLMLWALVVLTGGCAVAGSKVPPELTKAAEARVAAAEKQVEFLDFMNQKGFASRIDVLAAYHNWYRANREAPFPPARLLEFTKIYRVRAEPLRSGRRRLGAAKVDRAIGSHHE